MTRDEALLGAIRAHMKSLIVDRDDWRDAHISDLYGCDFATHARRSGDAAMPAVRDAEGALKMALGVDIEDKIAGALLEYYSLVDGIDAVRNERIAWNPKTGAVRRALLDAGHFLSVYPEDDRRCEGCAHCSPAADELIGHMDFCVQELDGETVFEIKSTSRFAFKKQCDAARMGFGHYVEQLVGYATAINAKRCGLFIADRDACTIEGPFWIDLDATVARAEGFDPELGSYRATARARALEVLANTDPTAFPPAPKPRYKWQPQYCSLGDACACKAMK
jgi:hypothetical protein